MGLDATIYCDCFEAGRLREPSPYPGLTSVAPDGSLACSSEDLPTILEFDQWLLKRACKHENGVLLHHHLGNISHVALLHNELARGAERFPILLEKVLYSGAHAGDYLRLDDVRDLQGELKQIDEFVCSDEETQEYVRSLRQQMQELVAAALSIGKPISF